MVLKLIVVGKSYVVLIVGILGIITRYWPIRWIKIHPLMNCCPHLWNITYQTPGTTFGFTVADIFRQMNLIHGLIQSLAQRPLSWLPPIKNCSPNPHLIPRLANVFFAAHLLVVKAVFLIGFPGVYIINRATITGCYL